MGEPTDLFNSIVRDKEDLIQVMDAEPDQVSATGFVSMRKPRFLIGGASQTSLILHLEECHAIRFSQPSGIDDLFGPQCIRRKATGKREHQVQFIFLGQLHKRPEILHADAGRLFGQDMTSGRKCLLNPGRRPMSGQGQYDQIRAEISDHHRGIAIGLEISMLAEHPLGGLERRATRVGDRHAGYGTAVGDRRKVDAQMRSILLSDQGNPNLAPGFWFAGRRGIVGVTRMQQIHENEQQDTCHLTGQEATFHVPTAI